MSKKQKKCIKIFVCIFICLSLLLVLVDLGLRFILPTQSVKTKVLTYISQTTGTEIMTGEIAASLFGIKVNNLSVDISGEDLFDAAKLQISLNPFKLLIGQVYVSKIILDKPSVKIIRYQDGTFNFTPVLASADHREEAKQNNDKITVPFDLRIKQLTVIGGQVSFNDLQNEIKASLDDLNFNLNKFSFYKPFDFNLSFKPYFEQNNIIFDGADIRLKAEVNLNKFDLQDAVFKLNKLLFKYKETALKVQADINNFENPSARISAELRDFTHETVSAFTEVLPFRIPLLTSDIVFDYFIQDSKANIEKINVKLADTELNLKANLDLNNNIINEGKINFKSVLDSFKDFSPHLEELKPTGQINADFDFAWPLALAGNLALADIGLVTDRAGTLENLNTQIEVKSIDEIKIETLSGILNKNPFEMNASYLKQQEFADVLFNFKADKLYVFDTSKKAKPDAKQVQPADTNPTTEEGQKMVFNFVPLHIDAKADIKKLDVPFLKGNNLIFDAKVKNVTLQMDKVHGSFALSLQNGQIKDVYTITDANAITKVMFMSLGIVSKVINTLNVLDLLNGMGKVLSSNKADDEELPVHQEINGKMDFDSFNTNIDFNEGLATMKKCSFVSNLFSFRVKGNINFNNRKINLNVDSAPGKHEENGIMPLNIDIKGTVENPKGSLSVLSSVGDLVGNTVTNNPVSNMLKSTWGSLFKSEHDKERNQGTLQGNQEESSEG